MKEIAPGVYITTQAAPVTAGAILTSDGWVCVDALPGQKDAQGWLAALREVSDQPVQYVINTDHHPDRTRGNGWFNAPIVVHEAAAEEMLAEGSPLQGLNANGDDPPYDSISNPAPPQLSYSRSLALHCGEHQVELAHRPSATLGSTWVILRQERVVFAGDSLCRTQHPHISDGASKAWLDALNTLRRERYAGWTLVSGREGIIAPAETEALSEYLRAARRRVGHLCRSNRPRAELSQFMADFMAFFPYAESDRERVQRRVRAGLEAIYDEIRGQRVEEVEVE